MVGTSPGDTSLANGTTQSPPPTSSSDDTASKHPYSVEQRLVVLWVGDREPAAPAT
jgi:hypothetical protein